MVESLTTTVSKYGIVITAHELTKNRLDYRSLAGIVPKFIRQQLF